ncbi:MAG TPA: pyridoxal phosphate-dependent aminotransferase, partial [Bacillota bacterium]|nr:pyridoxal phosphate-dependent aminotransferase [Bacillota bacterium]
MNTPILDLDLAELRGRTSMKWTTYDADVLPAWVAEMDCRPAEPVRRAVGD